MFITAPEDQVAFEDECFKAWMKLVDVEVVKLCGVNAADLPDFAYRDAYDDGASPVETATEAVAAAQD